VKTGDLAAVLGVKAPATTSLVDTLERDGLVSREHATDDRRVTFVQLTDKGRVALESAETQRREHMRHYMSSLSEEDIRTLIRIHRTLIESMLSQEA
jgi:DNA-binding MarR family transcriptional regulator